MLGLPFLAISKDFTSPNFGTVNFALFPHLEHLSLNLPADCAQRQRSGATLLSTNFLPNGIVSILAPAVRHALHKIQRFPTSSACIVLAPAHRPGYSVQVVPIALTQLPSRLPEKCQQCKQLVFLSRIPFTNYLDHCPLLTLITALLKPRPKSLHRVESTAAES